MFFASMTDKFGFALFGHERGNTSTGSGVLPSVLNVCTRSMVTNISLSTSHRTIAGQSLVLILTPWSWSTWNRPSFNKTLRVCQVACAPPTFKVKMSRRSAPDWARRLRLQQVFVSNPLIRGLGLDAAILVNQRFASLTEHPQALVRRFLRYWFPF